MTSNEVMTASAKTMFDELIRVSGALEPLREPRSTPRGVR